MADRRVTLLGDWAILTTPVLKVEAEGAILAVRVECPGLGPPGVGAKALLEAYRILEHHIWPDSDLGMQRELSNGSDRTLSSCPKPSS